MQLKRLNNNEEILNCIDVLRKVFTPTYPYYNEWLNIVKNDFFNSVRELYSIYENGKDIGYIMLHLCDMNCIKINEIFIYEEYRKHNYAKNSIMLIIDKLKTKKYNYLFLQTRINNEIVIHMCKNLGFYVIGTNYHDIEKKDNWVIAYDLKNSDDYISLINIANKLYKNLKIIT